MTYSLPYGTILLSISSDARIDSYKLLKVLNTYAWSDDHSLNWYRNTSNGQFYLENISEAAYPTLMPNEVISYEVEDSQGNLTEIDSDDMEDYDFDSIVDRELSDDAVPLERLVNELSSCLSAGSINMICVSSSQNSHASSQHLIVDSKNNGTLTSCWCTVTDGFNMSEEKVWAGMLIT